MADGEVICANRECRIAEDGKCLEGYEELSKCPYHGREPSDEEADHGPGEGAQPAFDGIHLPDGLALEAASANRILGILPSRMICIIGAYDSGKTSVIAGMYDLFQMGPVSKQMFAGSTTLHGLEMICHDARVSSQRKEPHSPRTNRGEVRFYHFDVLRDGSLGCLLIADRSGEEYEEVADVVANATLMFELRRADVITVLVDGCRLCSPEHRADAVGAIPQIVRAMVENGAFVRQPDLAIVLTKDDDVQASPKSDRAMADFKAVADGIRENYGSHFRQVRTFVTCASPQDPKAERGSGLGDLLDFWSQPTPSAVGQISGYNSGRMFDMLKPEELNVG